MQEKLQTPSIFNENSLQTSQENQDVLETSYSLSKIAGL